MVKKHRATYQRLVDSLFANQIGQNVKVYVDDMVIKSLNENTLLKDVEETLRTLEKARMKHNPAKCTFGVEEGQLLGYYVTKEGIQPSPTKVNELVETPSTCTLRYAQPFHLQVSQKSHATVPHAERVHREDQL